MRQRARPRLLRVADDRAGQQQLDHAAQKNVQLRIAIATVTVQGTPVAKFKALLNRNGSWSGSTIITLMPRGTSGSAGSACGLLAFRP
jgi:hypothetical protein